MTRSRAGSILRAGSEPVPLHEANGTVAGAGFSLVQVIGARLIFREPACTSGGWELARSTLAFCTSLCGDKNMTIHQDTMPAWERMVAAIPRGAIRGLDTLLRRAYGVYEFTDAEWCLLRVATIRSPKDITLSDGIKVAKGERIGELHLWNEHIPAMPRAGPDFRWGIRAYVLLQRSLRALAQYTLTDPELTRLRAWHGKSSFLPKAMGSTDALTKLGFDVVRPESNPNHLRRFVDAVDNSYWWVLAWTFNPASLNAKEWLRLERWEIWISAAKLRKKYGRRNQQNTAG